VSFAAGAALAASVALLLPVAQPDRGLADELVSGHIRALQPGHLLDVPSTDRHTVKPWFEGRIDFAPPVPDFAAQGFPLEGGRMDVVGGRSVAVLIYRHDKHPINVFVWPGAVPAGSSSRQGYGLRQWSAGGLGFHAVSDLDPAELDQFVRLWQAMP
jgi:anti-sigma factor RsiW